MQASKCTWIVDSPAIGAANVHAAPTAQAAANLSIPLVASP